MANKNSLVNYNQTLWGLSGSRGSEKLDNANNFFKIKCKFYQKNC